MWYCVDDFSRVELKEIKGKEGSDYINASFIEVSDFNVYLQYCLHSFLPDYPRVQSYSRPKEYIAAQGIAKHNSSNY